MEITAKTKQLGVIGYPIEHSFSPQMHNFIARQLNDDVVYSAFSVKPENLADAISGVRSLNIAGINVTAPHKIEVMKYLDEISPEAEILGSVNTVVNKNNVLTGYNTDSEGFYLSLVNAGFDVKGKNILIIGCGGVVMPILIRLIKENPKSVTLINRTKSKAEGISGKIYSATGYTVFTEVKCEDFDIIINTTTAGMKHLSDVLPWDSIDGFSPEIYIKENVLAVDMIYNPPCTKFLNLAKSKGCKIMNGLDMLIYQGIIAYELFTDQKLPNNMADLIRKEVFKR